jgi:Arc/MetJ-type ribon-helix-helix transcriptional regulator
MAKLDPAMLPEDVARAAAARIAAGRYPDVEAVLRAGVEALAEREQAEADWLANARAAWERGDRDVAAGRVTAMSSGEFSDWLRSAAADLNR